MVRMFISNEKAQKAAVPRPKCDPCRRHFGGPNFGWSRNQMREKATQGN